MIYVEQDATTNKQRRPDTTNSSYTLLLLRWQFHAVVFPFLKLIQLIKALLQLTNVFPELPAIICGKPVASVHERIHFLLMLDPLLIFAYFCIEPHTPEYE